jgi:hypothetical protein
VEKDQELFVVLLFDLFYASSYYHEASNYLEYAPQIVLNVMDISAFPYTPYTNGQLIPQKVYYLHSRIICDKQHAEKHIRLQTDIFTQQQNCSNSIEKVGVIEKGYISHKKLYLQLISIESKCRITYSRSIIEIPYKTQYIRQFPIFPSIKQIAR